MSEQGSCASATRRSSAGADWTAAPVAAGVGLDGVEDAEEDAPVGVDGLPLVGVDGDLFEEEGGGDLGALDEASEVEEEPSLVAVHRGGCGSGEAVDLGDDSGVELLGE